MKHQMAQDRTTSQIDIEPGPRLSRSKMFAVAAIYALWLGFMALMAAHRWLGVMQ